MPVSGRVYPCRSNRKQTCCGFARNFSAAKKISENTSCMATRRFAVPKSCQIGPTSTPEPTQPEILPCCRSRAAVCWPYDFAPERISLSPEIGRDRPRSESPPTDSPSKWSALCRELRLLEQFLSIIEKHEQTNQPAHSSPEN